MDQIDKHKHRQMTKSYFDRIASAEDKLWSGNVDKWDVVQGLFESIHSGGKILECGAGSGMYTIKMLQCGFCVTAVDISAKALEVLRRIASERGLDKNLITVESEFQDFAGRVAGKFDAVVYFKTLHHFPNLTSIREAICAGYEALKPNGLLLSLEPNGNCPFWRPFLLAMGLHGTAHESAWEAEKGLLMITQRNLTRIFQELENARWEFHWPYVIPAFVAQRLPMLCNPINRFLTNTPLRRYSFNLIFKVWKT